MAVIITGMDMPKNCIECGLRYREGDFKDYLFRCKITDNRLIMAEHARNYDCPLKSTDGLIKDIQQLKHNNTNNSDYRWWNNAIDNVEDEIKEYCEE